MNDTHKIKTGVVLANISKWCGILPFFIIIFYLLFLLIFIKPLQNLPYPIIEILTLTIIIGIIISPVISIIIGHGIQIFFGITGLSHAGAKQKVKTGLIFGYILLLIYILIYILIANSRICGPYPRLKASNNLNQLYILMMIYSQDWNEFPRVSPEGGNGVRDLYALYESGIMNDNALSLLQPLGCNLKPFSEKPTIDEFDKDHIGFSYNSTAKLDDPNNPPLLADQGVWNGYLQLNSRDRGIQPREEGGALVLYVDGSVEFVSVANKRGKLSTSKVSLEEWALLKDNMSTNTTIPLKTRHKNLKIFCALIFIAFIAFICILYTGKIWRTRVPAYQG
jgi:hypothetical protein